MYTAQAVHEDGLFELDGNTAVEAAPGDDWDSIYEKYLGGTPVLHPSNFASTFSDDNNAAGDGIDRTVWAEGSKDYNLMADNACTAKKNVGPNFDLEYTYTSFYDFGGDLWVAFGSDRDSVNGTKGLGVWLTQDEMSCDSETGDWVGERTPGDLLLVADYSNGGFVATIRAYLWDPTADNNLDLILDSNTADCRLTPDDPFNPNDGHHVGSPYACMTVNGPRGADTGEILTPWRGTLVPGQFAEGAANISALFASQGVEEPCFNTVLTEYRASVEKTSALHDFSVENVNTCGKVIIEKSTDPADATDDFSFDVEDSSNVDLVAPFMLKDGESKHIVDVHPGSYTAYETDPAPEWVLDNIICQDNYDESAVPPAGVVDDSSSNGAAYIEVSRNETVHCLFENEKLGNIIVRKVYTGEVANTTTFSYEVMRVSPAETVSSFNLEATVKESDHYDCDTDVQCKTIEQLAPDVYTVEETEVGDASFEDLACTSDNGNSTVLYNSATATIGLAAGDTVTCTYENFIAAAPGDIYLQKETIAFDDNGSPYRVLAGESFSYAANSSASGTGAGTGLPSPITLATVNGFVSQTYSPVYAGTHTVDEQAPPAGYQFHDLDCGLVADTQNPAPGADDVGTSVSGDVATITINDGEAVACLWRNKVIPAKAKVVKSTVPAGNESGWEFKLYKGAVLLATANTDASGNLDFGVDLNAGDYQVVETAQSGFDLTSVGGDDNNGADNVCTFTVAFPADRNRTFTCTFQNTERGDLKLIKNTTGGDGMFSFNHSIAGLDASLTTSGGTAFDMSDALVPGNSYAISETVPSGWDLDSFSCALEGGGSTGSTGVNGLTAITVEAGKTTTCTFANIKRGDLKLIKNTTGGDGMFSFNHSIAGLDASLTTSGGTAFDMSDALVPGNSYAISETVPSGWNLDSFSCALDGGGSTGSAGLNGLTGIVVEAGKTTTCTFVNIKITQEGCTPGYWRNHLDRWAETPYSVGDDFDSTFGTQLFNPDLTLGYVIDHPQEVPQVAFHGVAALLSAAHAEVDYPYTVAEVIALVQAGDAASLAAANELGCPIN